MYEIFLHNARLFCNKHITVLTEHRKKKSSVVFVFIKRACKYFKHVPILTQMEEKTKKVPVSVAA